ncbi:MAG: hypothetical protein J0665_19575 [Deltaproteobacteria bacterium]|nr:hypothetical protein [Deltaproteobacteria bacterium]
MGMHLQRIIKCILLLLAPLMFPACGGGGGGGAVPYKTIDNVSLFSALKDGSQEQNFPGVASFIDTKVVFQGADMFFGLAIDDAVKDLITTNVNSFLETSSPVFSSVLSPASAGVTVDATLKKITVALSETNANITISWSFANNSVVRSYTKTYVNGDFKGSTYTSTWTYSYNSGVTTATFTDSVDETELLASTKTLTKKLTYNGSVKYVRDLSDSSLASLTSAEFTQNHTETNNDTALTYILNGTVKMTGTAATSGTLSFDGGFSFDLPSYTTVSGLITLTTGTYGTGFDSANNVYYNETNILNGTLTLTSQADYSGYIPVTTNAPALRGSWVGEFTDSCSVNNPGNIDLSITETTSTWKGMSSDLSRIYGALILIDATGLHLKNNALSWGDSSTVTATTIAGNWSFGGCVGTFSVEKQ